MHVEIRPGSGATELKGTSKKSGQPYSMRVQEGWLSINGETRRLKMVLNREQPAHEPGVYDIDDSSFVVNNFGELAVGRLTLRARKPAIRQAG